MATLPDPSAPLPHGRFGRLLERVCLAFCLAGGAILIGLMLVESLSVIGRGLSGWLPVRGIAGDSEIVQIGGAVAIFSFLPLCQLQRGNVFVDFFTRSLSLRWRSALDLAANLVFLVLAGIIAWQLSLGMADKFNHGDTTTVLRLPESWPYLAAAVSAWLLVVVTAYTVARSAREVRLGRQIGPRPMGEG